MPAREEKALFWALFCAYTLLVFEAGIRLLDVDMIALRPLLFYQQADLPVHEPLDDAERIYRLKPGAAGVFPAGPGRPARRVSVNSLGFRGAPRQARKPAGVFRIVCLGYSHMYGAQVSDDETLPFYLEKTLNAGFRGSFEVWNAGVCAYSLKQASLWGREILRDFAPDLIILQDSNQGRRAFLQGFPFKPYFRRNPRLYLENLAFVPFGPHAVGSWLLKASALVRTAAAYASYGRDMGADHMDCGLRDYCAAMHRDAARELMAAAAGKTRFVLLTFKADDPRACPGVPSISLHESRHVPPGTPPEYFLVHPGPAVYALQAQIVAQELSEIHPGLFRKRVPGAAVVEP